MSTAKGFDLNKSPYAKAVQQVFQDFLPLIAHSSHPTKVAHAILNALNSPSLELRYPVGKDAESIFKARTELSDKEPEQWVRESYLEKKGVIRRP
ncbi:MAG: hypothetical protein GEU26_16340 [Nitrososphaeraceae archaeon]|nr:hypothetical protein [Nitrososphaeraceae archaeon]